jgi:hypothetical protein
MSIKYSGYTYYSEKEVGEREADAYQRGYKIGYQRALLDMYSRKKPLRVKIRRKNEKNTNAV